MQRRFDLNLLATFDALWRERSVTRAAQRLNVTQPAVSNALARLREAFGDELFVRTPKGVEPTARCADIAEDVHAALMRIERAVAGPDQFEPAHATREFRIGSTDYFDQTILPDLMAILSSQAPGLSVRCRAIDRQTGVDLLDQGELDIAIHGLGDPPKRIAMQTLLHEHFVLLARDPHPMVDGPVALSTLARLPQANFSQRGEWRSSFDDVFEAQGLSRRVVLTSSHSVTLGAVVGQTDIVAATPSRLARRLLDSGGLQAQPMPVELEGFSLALYWSRRSDADAGARWLRERIIAIADASPPYHPEHTSV